MENIANIMLNLYKMLINSTSTSENIIKYIETYNISVNTYLPSTNDEEMPLLYYCVIRPDLEIFFKYLIEKNVNFNSKIHTKNGAIPIDLLIYSDVKYIKYLITKVGCTLNKKRVKGDIYNLLIRGSINKVLLLIKYNVIENDDILDVLKTKNILFITLDKLYERIFKICKIYNENILSNINECIDHYINTFKFYFNNGVDPNSFNEETNTYFVQNVLNTYFYELILLLINKNVNFNNMHFYHFSNFVQDNRHIMTAIYNEENYKKINNLISSYVKPKKIKIINLLEKSYVKKGLEGGRHVPSIL